MINIFGWFSTTIENKVREKGISSQNGIVYIYEKLFYGTVLVALIMGFLALGIGVFLAIFEGEWLVAIIDILSYSTIVFLYFDKRVSTKQKVDILLIVIYLLAIILIIKIGPYGAGILWLTAYSIVASVFGGIKLALRSIIINAVTLVTLGLLTKFNFINISYYKDLNFIHWVSFVLNMLVINILSSFLVAFFFDSLKRSLQIEYTLKKRLKIKSEKLIKAKIKAEESDRLKSSFLANVSHEFLTPMNAIMGFTEIMLHTNPKEAKRKKYLNYIEKSTEQLLHLINNTLEYSKIEMGIIQLKVAEVNIFEMFKMLYEKLKTDCPENVSFKFDVPENSEEESIYTDRDKLFQIFYNLISNSFKFTNYGNVTFGQMESEHKKFVKFFVMDTGIGIKKEKQKDIFTRFYKEDEFKKGTGLGLAISATLIAHMNGRIWLESEMEQGSKFFFILPKKLVIKSDI